jgi:hypothetical protein
MNTKKRWDVAVGITAMRGLPERLQATAKAERAAAPRKCALVSIGSSYAIRRAPRVNV